VHRHRLGPAEDALLALQTRELARLSLDPLRARLLQPAGSDEVEDPTELGRVEPPAVPAAPVDHDAGAAREVAPVHYLGANGAREVAHGRLEGDGPAGRLAAEGRGEAVVARARDALEERLVEPEAAAARALDVARLVGLALAEGLLAARTRALRERAHDGLRIDAHAARAAMLRAGHRRREALGARGPQADVGELRLGGAIGAGARAGGEAAAAVGAVQHLDAPRARGGHGREMAAEAADVGAGGVVADVVLAMAGGAREEHRGEGESATRGG
jgi:hypothetical protein